MSLRKAINNKCKECIYDPYEPGTWRMQVEGCTSLHCPLYPVRPIAYIGKKEVDDDTAKLPSETGKEVLACAH
jgi:hypothetical protein